MSGFSFLDQLGALADPIRARALLALEGQELTVSELCAVLQLPQSTVSRHLKTLGDQGWLARRADGTKHFYGFEVSALQPADRRLWMLVRHSLQGSAQVEQDAERVHSVLRDRASRSAEFFSSAAERWDDLRAEVYGNRFDVLGLFALLRPEWTIADLGCGTGQLAAAVAPFVERVLAIDSSPAMMRAAKARLAGVGNVELRRGKLEQLPVEDGEVDLACLFLVLHHVAEPAQVVREAARSLKPGGRVLVVDMRPHEREELRQQMGHVWLGFDRELVERLLFGSGLGDVVWRSLPADPQAKGPGLFVVSGRKPVESKQHPHAVDQPRRAAVEPRARP